MYFQLAYKGLHNWWRYLVVLLIVFGLNVIAGIPIAVVAFAKALSGGADLTKFSMNLNAESLGLSQNAGLFLMVAPLAIVFFGLVYTIKNIHGFKLVEVFTSHSTFRWKNFFIAACLWLILLVAGEVVFYLMNPGSYVFHFYGSKFFVLLIICLLFIPLQASWEELYFRGNLMQGLGLLTRTRIVPLILTSTIFGLMHFFNPEVKQFGIANAMIQYIGFGLLLGVAVIMDGGLEMAFGIHVINNIYAAAFVSYSGSVLQTPALISSVEIDPVYMSVAFFVAGIIFLLVSKKIFKWQSFTWIFKPLK
jgi:uncharacterized protein